VVEIEILPSRSSASSSSKSRGWSRGAPANAAPANAAAATTDVGDLAVLGELFGPTWGTLPVGEQARALRLLVERVDHDGSAGQVRIRLRSAQLVESPGSL
jgi:hypothetical protein